MPRPKHPKKLTERGNHGSSEKEQKREQRWKTWKHKMDWKHLELAPQMRGWTCILEPWFLGGPSHFIPLETIVPLPGCYSARCIQKVGSQAHWSEKRCSFQRSNKNGLRQKKHTDFSGGIFLAREKNQVVFLKDFFLLNNIASGNKQMFGFFVDQFGGKITRFRSL